MTKLEPQSFPHGEVGVYGGFGNFKAVFLFTYFLCCFKIKFVLFFLITTNNCILALKSVHVLTTCFFSHTKLSTYRSCRG